MSFCEGLTVFYIAVLAPALIWYIWISIKVRGIEKKYKGEVNK